MANEIKDLFGAVTTFAITIASLATSALGVGRQSTMVSNTTTRYQRVKVPVKIKLGTSPTANRAVYIFGITGDGAGIRDDGAGASDAAITVKNLRLLGTLQTGASAATGDVLIGVFDFYSPGAEFGVALFHDTGVALDATAGSHVVEYYGVDPEVQ